MEDADLSRPLSNPFLSLAEVLLEVESARSQHVLQRFVHHVLHQREPTLRGVCDGWNRGTAVEKQRRGRKLEFQYM